MNSVIKMLHEAVIVSCQRHDDRNFRVGAIAIRGDGAIVKAYNGAPKFPMPEHHAEGRLCRKLDCGAIVYVARVTKDGKWAMSKPCPDCERLLRCYRAKKVYYTIAPNEWGCLLLK